MATCPIECAKPSQPKADHVGIGLDFFQGHNVMKHFDASGYPRLAQALEKVASPGDVKKIAGENWVAGVDCRKNPMMPVNARRPDSDSGLLTA